MRSLVGFLLVLLARFWFGLALLDALLLLFLTVGGLAFGVLLLAGVALRFDLRRRFLLQPVGARKRARCLAVCLVPSAMVRPRGPGYPSGCPQSPFRC